MDSSSVPEKAAVSCSVCLEIVEEGGDRSTAKLKCGHRFHLDCIGSAFNAKGAMQCPNCRHVEDGQWLYASGMRSSEDFSFEDYIIEDEYDYGFAELPPAGDDVILAAPPVPGVSPLVISPDHEPMSSSSWGPCPHLGHCPHPHFATISFEGRLDRHYGANMDAMVADVLYGDPLHSVPMCPHFLASHNSRPGMWPLDSEAEVPVYSSNYHREGQAEHQIQQDHSVWGGHLQSGHWPQPEIDRTPGSGLYDQSHRLHSRHGAQYGPVDTDHAMLGGSFGGVSPLASPPIPSWFEEAPHRLPHSRALTRNQHRHFPSFHGAPSSTRASRQGVGSSSMGGRRGLSPDQRSLPSGGITRAGGPVGGGANGMVVREGWRWRAEAPGLAARGEVSLPELWADPEGSRPSRMAYHGHGSSSSGTTGSMAGLAGTSGNGSGADGFQDLDVLSSYESIHGAGLSRETQHGAWRSRNNAISSHGVPRWFDRNGPPGLEFRCLLCNDISWRDARAQTRRTTFGDFSALRQHTIARHSFDPHTGVTGTAAL